MQIDIDNSGITIKIHIMLFEKISMNCYHNQNMKV